MLMPISYQTDGNSEIPKKKAISLLSTTLLKSAVLGDAKLARTGLLC